MEELSMVYKDWWPTGDKKKKMKRVSTGVMLRSCTISVNHLKLLPAEVSKKGGLQKGGKDIFQ